MQIINFNGINLLDGSSTTKLDLAAGKLGGQTTTAKEIAATGTTSGIAAGDKAAVNKHTLTVELQTKMERSIIDVEYEITAVDDKGKAIRRFTMPFPKNDTLSSMFDITKDGDGVDFVSKIKGSKGAKVVEIDYR